VRRRAFIALLGGAAAWPLAAAQQATRMRRIGIVMPYAKGDSEVEPCVRAFKQELAKLGWTEGGNVQFEEHWTTDNMEWCRACGKSGGVESRHHRCHGWPRRPYFYAAVSFDPEGAPQRERSGRRGRHVAVERSISIQNNSGLAQDLPLTRW